MVQVVLVVSFYLVELKIFCILFLIEEEFVWCYKDPKCDQFAWNKNVPVS